MDAHTAYTILENLHTPVLVLDAEGIVRWANAAAGAALARPRDALVGSAFGHPADRDGGRTEISAMRGDGVTAVFDLQASPMTVDGEALSVVTLNDVSERQADARRMTGLVEELRRTNRELERFLYIASHDLQEPVRLIHLHVQKLEREAGEAIRGQPGGAEAMQEIRRGAERALGQVHDLLTYGQVTAEERPFEDVALPDILAGAQRTMRAMIAETGARIEVADPLPTVRGDPFQLSHLFHNLLGNALKFRRPDTPPEITVTCRPGEDGDWHLTLTDNGIGIAARHAEHIFEVFQRLHPPDTYPGTGVGLALCRRIVENAGGRIWAEPRPDGQGTTVHFTLPGTG